MRKTHETVKHAVDRVITNLNLFSENNDAHSEPVREIHHIYGNTLHGNSFQI